MTKISAPRVLEALQNRIWALHPAKLEEISAFIQAKLEGKKINFEAVAGQAQGSDRPYSIIDGVAVIPVNGTLERRLNLFSAYSGGTSTQILARTITQAAQDNQVIGIVLDVDSPGGSVHGTLELAQAVAKAAKQKRVIAYTGGLMASAALWASIPATQIVAIDTAEVGSIGVAAVHYDYSERDKQLGVKRTVISAGKYKRIASDEKPLSKEGRAYLQSMVDYYYSIFIDTVAEHRSVDTDTVLEKMADGKIFIGRQALEAGLVDHIGNFEMALELARENRRKKVMNKDAKDQKKMDWAALDIATLRQERPDLYEAIEKDAHAKGVQEERARVVEILEAKGDAKITLQAIKDGTPATEAYKQFFLAAKQEREQGLKEMQDALSDSAGVEGKDKKTPEKDFMALVDEYQEKHKCTRTEALSAVAAKHPDLHQAYLESLKEGK